MNNNVNSPAHYKVGGIETIDFIEAKRLNYNLGNVVKYITRADHKANRLEDLQKAAWYLSREISNYPLAEVMPKVVEDKPNLYGRGDPRKVKGVKTHKPQRYGHNTLLALSYRNKERMPAVGTDLLKAWQAIVDLLGSGPAHRKDLTATLETIHPKPNLSKYITIFLDRGLLKVVK